MDRTVALMQLTRQVLEQFRLVFRESTGKRFISHHSVCAAKDIHTLKILNKWLSFWGGGDKLFTYFYFFSGNNNITNAQTFEVLVAVVGREMMFGN